jgi:ribosomal protein L11 methylase PrmA
LSEPEITSAALEPGSFRDPDSRVASVDGRILRLLSERGLAEWRAFSASPLFAELVREEKLVGTHEADDVALPGAAGVLEHDVVPFVSYPYEWSFGMLRDAALLQLELVRRAVEAGLMLKDSTPYNVQFRGARPVFVDVGSFEPLREGEPWAGYRQFCMLFLYPLLLAAWKGVPFQPWLRGSIDGVAPLQMRSLLSFRDRFRRGALTHVVLHARLERRYEERDTDLKRELKAAGFRKELILANVKKLEKLVSGLTRRAGDSAWSGYAPTTTYSDEDAERKARFVAEAVEAERPRVVWDLGCNEGRHARIASETAKHVVAVDADEVVVDRLYDALKAEGTATILPLTMNLADPSPGLGWRGLERRSLAERGTPDLALCLALVHHLSISGNVPVAEVVEWLRSLGASLVVEFPTPDDPMVARLLRRKREHDHPDYRRDWFERCLGERFDVARTEELASGSRVLYLARPRS